MKAFRITMMDGSTCLALPGIGVAVPGRDPSGKELIGCTAILLSGHPPMPTRESMGDLEEKYNGPTINLK
jgi:hypothetical protein